MVRTFATLIGIVLLAFGVLFLLQGMNVIRWPADSFMLGRQTWITRGAIIAAAAWPSPPSSASLRRRRKAAMIVAIATSNATTEMTGMTGTIAGIAAIIAAGIATAPIAAVITATAGPNGAITAA
jgi:uncharacterized membrane protein YczE